MNPRVDKYRLLTFGVMAAVAEAGVLLARLGREATPFALVLIPPAAALVATGFSRGLAGIVRLLASLGRWRVGARWYLAALGIPFLGTLAIDVVGLLLGAASLDRIFGALTASALLIPVVVVVPAMLEELGWRGFAVQAAVDAGHSPGWATSVVGLMFVTAHIPLYLPGQIYDNLPLWPLPITLLAYAVLLTWIYLRTGSVLLAGLMHAALNATLPLTWGLDPGWAWQARAGVFGVIAALVMSINGRTWWRSSMPTPVSFSGTPIQIHQK